VFRWYESYYASICVPCVSDLAVNIIQRKHTNMLINKIYRHDKEINIYITCEINEVVSMPKHHTTKAWSLRRLEPCSMMTNDLHSSQRNGFVALIRRLKMVPGCPVTCTDFDISVGNMGNKYSLHSIITVFNATFSTSVFKLVQYVSATLGHNK
jgi:hypothetical protein